MVYRKYRLFAWLLALIMCASFCVAAFLPAGKPTGALGSAQSARPSLTEESSLRLADTSSAFGDVVRIAPEVKGKQWLIVSLEDESLAARSGGQDVNAYAQTAKGRRAEKSLRSGQQEFLAGLQRAGIPYEYRYGYTLLLNAVAVRVDVRYAEQIARMDGVKSVDISEYYYAPQDIAVSNNANVWGTGIYKVDESIAAEYDGSGMVVAVLDTGLDASHEAFLTQPSGEDVLTKEEVAARVFDGAPSGVQAVDPSVTVDDVYYSKKVPFAYDYADRDTDVYPSYSSHGTHVAGIIAGSPILGEDGEPETIKDQDGNDILDKDGNPMTFTGVAPEAQLAFCKVFTDNENSESLGGAETMDILAALEDCIKLEVDIINMSLGSSAGFSTGDDEYMQAVYDNVRKTGIMLVTAASNDYSSGYGGAYGTNLASNPDSGTVGSPSTYPGALSVASINGQQSKYIRVSVGGEDKYLYFTEASDGNGNEKDFVKELKEKNPSLVDADGNMAVPYVVVPGYGLSVNYTRNIDVTGKIAVVRRGGDVTFEQKVRIAKQKGAIGCVIYNNVSGIIHMSLGNLNDPIPTCSITMDAANNFVSSGAGTMYISDSQKAGPFMSDFSSWGPTPDLRLKPEISAHGGEITSSVANGWDEYSGTSMASPNMAGAMSLILSYVRRHVDYDSDHTYTDDVAVSNFLVMSTATIARDEFDRPYSPRKQGAGLADIKKAITTQAYAYQAGIDKAKIEVGDDPDRTGKYELTFRVRNMSEGTRTYTLGTQTMTETIASDGMTVAERAYMLDSMADITFAGDGVKGNTLTLAGGADVEVRVTIRLQQSAKDYLDRYFENGMYVEGFVTLTDTSSDAASRVDLNIPWLGFYGDWYAAPMMDMSEYELSAALQDDSIPEDEKPQAAIYPTVPLGSYYDERYIIPLGTYLYEQDPAERQIYSSADKAAISIYDEEGHRTVSQLYAIYAGMLRGAETMNVTITDAVTGEVVFSEQQRNIRKAYTGGSSTARASIIELEWSARELGLENNRQYLFHMDGEMADLPGREYDASLYSYNKSFDFNFYIDTEAPEIVDYRVRYEPYKDESDKTRYNVFLDVDVYDNHYAQSIALCFADYTSMTLELLDTNMIPVYSERNSVTTVSIDITDYYDQDVDLYLQVDDYALNARAYRVSDFKPLPDAVDYPDSIEIVTGEDVSAEDYSKTVSIGVNEALKLETLVSPENAANVNLYWHSFDESVVRVQDGELFGVRPGTAVVRVYGGKNEYAAASDGILVTVTDEVNAAPGITKLGLGLIENSDNNLVNPTNEVVSVHPNTGFRMSVEIEPWYSSADPVIVWESTVPDVATVNRDTGFVRTLAEGSTVIRATLYQDGRPTLYSASTTLSVGPEFIVENGYLREYHGPGGKVTIPKSLNVYYIYEEAFRDNTNITELEISAPCIEIQPLAFSNMKALRRVVLPDTIEYVYRNAFYNCPNLERIDLHSRSISFGAYCFADCASLKYINNVQLLHGLKAEDVNILDLEEGTDFIRIPAHMTTIGAYCFANCTSLEELDITELRVAGQAAFYNCAGLKKVRLSRFTAVSDDMFLHCSALSELVYTDVTPDDVSVLTYANIVSPFGNCKIDTITFESGDDSFIADDVGGVLVLYADSEKKTLVKVGQNASSFAVPASVEVIAPNAFSGNTSLRSVTFAEGGSLREIGAYAFSGTGLTSVTLPAGIQSLGRGVFSWCEVMTSADLSAYTGELPAMAFYNASVTQVTFGAGMTAIGSESFAGTALTSLDLTGTQVTSIGDRAFAGCENLAQVRLGAIASLGSGVFAAYGSGALESVSFGSGSADLGTDTFSGQASLRTVDLSTLSSLTEIGRGVFRGCSSLVSLALAPVSAGDSAFEGCTALTGIDLSGLKSAGSAAFKNCAALTVAALPALESAGDEAFYGCTGIVGLTLPAATSLGARAFMATGLRSVEMPVVETVGSYAFANTAIGTGTGGVFEIPSSVRSIGEGAFSGLTFVTSFVLGQNEGYFVEDGILYGRVPNGVQVLAYPAGKSGDVVLHESTVRTGASAFENAIRVTSVQFPYAFRAVGDRSFYNCGATRYIFGCLQAPVLEAKPLTASDFAPGEDMYLILNETGSIGSEKYYANFKDYVARVIFAGQKGVTGVKDLGLTVVCPENATGFDGRIYGAYFSTLERSELIADDTAREALRLIGLIPSADKVNALTGSDTAQWAEYRASVTAARNAYNLVTPTQSRFVTNSDALYATESAMRAKAELFGETVVRQSILVNTYPNKMEYVRGEKFERAGLSLLLIWSDGSREVISDGYEIVNQDSVLTLNDRTIRIRYMGLQTQISVTVRRPDVQSLEIAEYPASQSYRPGDTYMSAGLVLRVIYVDGESELLYTGYTVDAEPLQEGENTVTVSYGGKSITYTVTVGNGAAVQPEPENNDRTVVIAVSVSAAVVVAAGAVVLAVVLVRRKKGKA